MKRARLILLVALSLMSAGLYAAATRLTGVNIDIGSYMWLFFALFVVYAAASALLIGTRQDERAALAVVVAAAAVFRAIMVVTPPYLSTDAYRYGAGAVYPPAAMLLFSLTSQAGPYAVTALKVLLASLDLGTIFLLLALLQHTGKRRSLVILYAWSPLVITEVAWSGHIDGLAAFLAVAAVYLAVKRKPLASGAAAGLAAAAKLFPAVLLPAIAGRRDLKPWAAGFLSFAALSLPYLWGAWPLPPAGFAANAPRFNPGLKAAFEWLCGGGGARVDLVYAVLAAVALAAVCVRVQRRDKEGYEIVRSAYILLGLTIVLLPFTSPWYLVVVMPFAAAVLSPAFLYLSGAVALSYLFYLESPGALPGWAQAAEFTPFFILLTWETFRGSKSFKLTDPVDDA